MKTSQRVLLLFIRPLTSLLTAKEAVLSTILNKRLHLQSRNEPDDYDLVVGFHHFFLFSVNQFEFETLNISFYS